MGRRLDHGGTVALQREMADAIDSLCVGSEQHGLGVHQVFPDHDLGRPCRAERAQAFPQRHLTDGHQLGQINLGCAVELLQVQQALCGIARSDIHS